MSKNAQRDTLLAFYCDDFGPSASEGAPMPPHAAQDVQEQLKSNNNGRQPSQYLPNSRVKQNNSPTVAPSTALQPPSASKSRLNAVHHSPDIPFSGGITSNNSLGNPGAAGNNRGPPPNPLDLTRTRVHNNTSGDPFASPSSSPNQMDFAHSPYTTSPSTGRPMLSVDPSYGAQRLQEPPRAAFAAPPSPASSFDGSTKEDGLKWSAGAASPAAQSPISRTKKKDQDRFDVAARASGMDFWKRFSMVVHENENEKGGSPHEIWLAKEEKKRSCYKRWIWAAAVLIVIIIVVIVVYFVLKPDEEEEVTDGPDGKDFGLSPSASPGSTAERLVRRAWSSRPHGATRSMQPH